MFGRPLLLAGVLAAAEPRSCSLSSAHAHWIVPAAKTSAPLGCRYIVIACVAAPLA